MPAGMRLAAAGRRLTRYADPWVSRPVLRLQSGSVLKLSSPPPIRFEHVTLRSTGSSTWVALGQANNFIAVRLSTSMRTPAVASLFLMTGIVGAALVGFIVTDASARTAKRELLAFSEHAQQEAQKRRIFPISPAGYIVSMVPPTISSSDREQIDNFQGRNESLIRRRALTEWLFTRGVAVAIVIATFCWLQLASSGRAGDRTRTSPPS